uniref:MAK10-like protein n=1 Tax=Tanacetum cinerariifolium TaxID=118510 RepID=A0A6L2KW12_TANCI|nr:MAK10-like protein [Tanacetum cinerariifolium]
MGGSFTRFLAQFFPSGRTTKLRNDILMFQQHHGESLSEAWTRLRTYSKKSLIMASTFGSNYKYFMTMSIPSQDEPLTNRPMYCKEDLAQAFVEYASSRIDEARGWFLIIRHQGRLHKGGDGEVMFIELIRKNDDSSEGEPEEERSTTTERVGAEYFNIFPTKSELAYHKYLRYGLIPSIFLRNPIIIEGYPSNLKIPCNIGHVHMERAYIDLNSPSHIMTRMMYNWIMRRKLDPEENTNRRVSNFKGRIKRMHIFVGNFTNVIDFMIVEDISSIIDARLSQVVLGRPFVEISNMTHDPPE